VLTPLSYSVLFFKILKHKTQIVKEKDKKRREFFYERELIMELIHYLVRNIFDWI
jgi:hypothetical protein